MLHSRRPRRGGSPRGRLGRSPRRRRPRGAPGSPSLGTPRHRSPRNRRTSAGIRRPVAPRRVARPRRNGACPPAGSSRSWRRRTSRRAPGRSPPRRSARRRRSTGRRSPDRTSTATGCAGRTPRSRGGRPRRRRTGCPAGTRYGSGPVGVGLDPQHLAQERAERLSVAPRVAAAAAVAETDVEVAVGPEDEIAAVVVVVGLVDEQHLAAAKRRRRGRRASRSPRSACPR